VRGDETIGNWTQTTLIKWLRDVLQNQPPDFLPNLKAQRITVTSDLSLKDKLTVADASFRKIGGTGQPAFQNSWVNFNGGYQEAGFWRDPFGWVHLRGLIKSGSVNTPAFTLPPGFRPLLTEIFPVLSNGAIGRVDVVTDGTVVVVSPSSNVYVSLSSIRFRTS
jgi:hypothetical protein